MIQESESVNIEELIEQIGKGDTSKLEKLYENTSTAIFGYALSMLKNKSDAEDIVHDCFLKIYASSINYRKQGKPLAWILTIARNLCLEKLRRGSKEANLDIEDWMLIDSDAISHEEKIALRESMLILNEEERQIVYLHAVAGLKHREISQVMNIGLGTILSKYNRAIKKLRIVLEKGE